MAIKKNTNDLLSQAATTLADNSTQDISPQDIREMAENNAFSSYNKITDNNLVGLKNYSTAATYEAAQGVVYNGSIYISNTIPTPGAFNPSEWDILSGGEINTSSNSGTGEGLALAKSGSNLPFKSLTAGTGITLTSAATELEISSAGGTDTNIGNSNITFDANRYADLNDNYWQLKDSTGVNRLLLDFQQGNANGHGIGYGGAAVDGKHTFYNIATSGTQALGQMSFLNGLKLSNGSLEQDYLNFGSGGFVLHIKSHVSYGSSIGVYPDITLRTRHSSTGIVLDTNNFTSFKKNTVEHSRIDSSSRWILKGSAVIGSEKISLQDDTLIKGSDNAAATSGFKVIDVNNVSLLEVRNNGSLKLQNLPSLPAGTVAGDVWSQNGTLRIGNPTANIQTEVSASTITPNIDTTKLIVTSALAAALTIAAPTGTPQEGQELTFRFKDDGTARALTWNAIFEDYTGSLPTTTTAGKTVYIGCKYNLINTKWDVVAVQNQP